jgi:hypothetical protein
MQLEVLAENHKGKHRKGKAPPGGERSGANKERSDATGEKVSISREKVRCN